MEPVGKAFKAVMVDKAFKVLVAVVVAALTIYRDLLA
jgi:hypothetical protein